MSYSDYIKYLEENNKSANMSNLNDYIKANNLSAEDKRGILQQQMLGRVAGANGMTVNQLVSYGNNADLWNSAKKGESVVLSTPNTDAKKAAYYSQQAATPVSGYYDFLAKNALDTKGVTYAMAEKMRQESEALAEIQRKRSIVDASTIAEQQKATYGANAEQMGRMGLSGSGYSDYLNSQAYAAGMAGRQAANAQATDANRKAMYTEMMAKLEADKEYNNALAQIETAKYNEQKALEERNYAEQKQKEAQQQTNYGNLIDAIVNSNGVINKDNVEAFASKLGITDTKLLGDAVNFATTYGENTPKTLTETEIQQINNAYEAAIQNGDYITAGDEYIKGNHYDASEEQKKTYLATFMVDNIESINPEQWGEVANRMQSGGYGDKGAQRIKEAFSSSKYATEADSLPKADLKKVIDSGLLTDKAKSRLEVMYENKFDDSKQSSVYDKTSFDKFAGSGKDGSKQDEYINALKDLASGDIVATDGSTLAEGDYVIVNYGRGAGDIYKYLGNGKLEKYSSYGDWWQEENSERNKIKVPQGYHLKGTAIYKD
jgi:hypothetical protein